MRRAKVIYGRVNKYFIDEQEVTRAEFDRAFPNRIKDLLKNNKAPDGARPACWPMKGSDALSVIPDRIPEAAASDLARGVPTEYTSEGQPIFRDRGHRKEYMNAYGYHDRSGGYGD